MYKSRRQSDGVDGPLDGILSACLLQNHHSGQQIFSHWT